MRCLFTLVCRNKPWFCLACFNVCNFESRNFSFELENVPFQNATQFGAFLPWFEEINLGFAWPALMFANLSLKINFPHL
jgi:hypothetical protein